MFHITEDFYELILYCNHVKLILVVATGLMIHLMLLMKYDCLDLANQNHNYTSANVNTSSSYSMDVRMQTGGIKLNDT